MTHTFLGISFVIIYPIFVYYFLNKNEKFMNEENFKRLYGSMYEG
jgi:hypothetical protein